MSEHHILEALPEDWECALAVIAHPDDMEYGASSAVARWTSQGKRVKYLLITRGEAGINSESPEKVGPIREAEERKSAAVVGVNDIEFLGYQDGIIEYGLHLRRDITRAIRHSRPEIIISISYHLTWPGAMLNMADHRWVGLAVLDAARDAGNRWIFPELLKEGFEPWSGVRMVCFASSPQVTHAVDISEFLEQGIASLLEHKVYLKYLGQGFDPQAFLRDHATEMGKSFGCKYAVGFEVIKI